MGAICFFIGRFMKHHLLQTISDAKVAATVAGGTTITSLIDLIYGGVSIFAVAAGATLSLSLIIIHWKRWQIEKKESKVRFYIEKEHARLKNEALKLKLEALQREASDEKEK